MLVLLITLFLLADSPVVAPAPVPSPSAAPAATPALPDWYSRLSPPTPGAFPLPRSYHANYRVTWGVLEAAHVEAQVKSPADDSTQIRTGVKAVTIGTSRALYKLDGTYLAIVDRRTLLPKFLEQTERNAHKNVSSRVDFAADGATRRNRDLSKTNPAEPDAVGKPRRFPYPNLYDMTSVLLALRSQPLADGDERSLLLMTAASPYLVTVKVVGHGHVKVKAGDYPAIECSLKLEKVANDGALQPRKGFKSAHAWLSDDADRLLIKAQSEVFIGSVSLELERVTFPGGARPL